MQNENLATSTTPNGNPNLPSEVQTFTLQGEKVINGTSTSLTITISVQDGVVQSVQAQGADGSDYNGQLRLKLEKVQTPEETGEECECCTPGPKGMVCVICPCP